jgi:hypothetical protein
MEINNKFTVKEVVLFFDANTLKIGVISGIKYEEEITSSNVYKKELKYSIKYKYTTSAVESVVYLSENVIFKDPEEFLEYYKKFAYSLVEEYKAGIEQNTKKPDEAIRQKAVLPVTDLQEAA